MTAKKISVSLPPPIHDRLVERASHQGISAEIQHTIGHHFAAVQLGRKRLAQKLSRKELFAILDSCNGLYWDSSILPMMLQGGVLANVSDACALDGLHDKWEVDRGHLCETINTLSDLEQFALLDMIHEFWNRCDEDFHELASDFPA